MEQNNDLKQELQQELLGLQQEIEQHSTFNKEIWRRSVKRYTRSLYRQNILCVVFLAVMMGASLGILYFVGHWPWWVIIPDVLFFGVVIADNLIATRGMARPDVGSKEGLRSLRACIQDSSSRKSWRVIIYRICGICLSLLTAIYLWFNDRSLLISLAITVIITSLVFRFSGPSFLKRIKNRYNELGEEIDELLKEK